MKIRMAWRIRWMAPVILGMTMRLMNRMQELMGLRAENCGQTRSRKLAPEELGDEDMGWR
uniref:Uncharacterized protein n=1 Tax=Rhizophora mucronata TaxID=61149 RepID=A0A2P2Q438_RHIMU